MTGSGEECQLWAEMAGSGDEKSNLGSGEVESRCVVSMGLEWH